MDLLKEAPLLVQGYEKYTTKYSVMTDEDIEDFKNRIRLRPHKKQLEDIQHLRISSSETVFYIKYKEEQMDLNQINKQLKVMQIQLNVMQQAVAGMLVTGNKPAEPEKYYVLEDTGISDRTYTIEELDIGRIQPYNAYPTEGMAKLVELERKIMYTLENYAREVNNGRKVDVYDNEQEKYIITIRYMVEETSPYCIDYIAVDTTVLDFNIPVFLEMDRHLLEECRKRLEHLANEYFELRLKLGLF